MLQIYRIFLPQKLDLGLSSKFRVMNLLTELIFCLAYFHWALYFGAMVFLTIFCFLHRVIGRHI